MLESEVPPCEIHLFGSSVNFLGLISSDADLTIIANGIDNHPLASMNKLRKVLHKAKMVDIIAIKFARVPICKFRDPILNINCDINFGHALGVENSKLLRAYVSQDSRVRPLLLMIKEFAKARGICDPAGNGNRFIKLATISSYAYCLMAIAYLQHLGILPNLQSSSLNPERKLITVPATRDPFGEQITVDVSFADVRMSGQELSIKTATDADMVWGETGVTSLLEGFLHYYGYEYQYGSNIAVSIRDGGFVAFENPKKCGLIVMDPFELERNCTSFVTGSLKAIRNEFKSAYAALRAGTPNLLFVSNHKKPKAVWRRHRK